MSDPPAPRPELRRPRRSLRAAFVADIENYSGRVSVGETIAFHNTSAVLAGLKEEVDRFEGHVITTPGDGMVVLFESAVDAARCALATHERFRNALGIGGMRLRIGLHLGEVILEGPAPMGEPINVAVRLQSMATPGATLITEDMFNAVSTRVSARFEAKGYPPLRNIPRRIAVYEMRAVEAQEIDTAGRSPLDQTTKVRKLKSVPAGEAAISSEPKESRVEGGVPSAQPAPTAAPAAVAPAVLDDVFTDDVRGRIVVLLARAIGPVAPVLLRRAIGGGGSIDDVLDRLAAGVSDPSERARLRAEFARIAKGH